MFKIGTQGKKLDNEARLAALRLTLLCLVCLNVRLGSETAKVKI